MTIQTLETRGLELATIIRNARKHSSQEARACLDAMLHPAVVNLKTARDFITWGDTTMAATFMDAAQQVLVQSGLL